MSALDDAVSTLKGAVTNLSQLVQTLQNSFPRIGGTFTLANATTTSVSNTSVGVNFYVVPFPTNASGALLMRSQGLYIASHTSGVGFTVSTQTGTAAGTETFNYVGLNLS